MSPRKRHKKKKLHPLSHAREIALQGLYQIELGAQSVAETSRLQWLNAEPDADKKTYALELLEGVHTNKGTLDVALHVHSHKHRTQISNITRVILRMALFEMQRGTVPIAIIMDEYLNLAGRYDSEDAVPFVNGILETFRKEAEFDTEMQTASSATVETLTADTAPAGTGEE